MSLLELKESVLALPEHERHDFVAWVNRLEADYGDVPGEPSTSSPRKSGTKTTVMPLPRIQRGELWLVDLVERGANGRCGASPRSSAGFEARASQRGAYLTGRVQWS